MARPCTALDAPGAAFGVDGDQLSGGERGRKSLSAGSSTVNPGEQAASDQSQEAPDARAPRRLNAKLEPRSGRLQQRLPERWRPRRRAGLQSDVGEDALDHRRLEDGGADLQLAAAVRAVFEVELEGPFEQPGPAHPHRPAMRAVRLAGSEFRCGGGLVRPLRNHHRAQLGVGRQHAMKANEVQARPRHQCSQPLHHLQRRHRQVCRAAVPGRLQLQHDLAGRVALHAFVGQNADLSLRA